MSNGTRHRRGWAVLALVVAALAVVVVARGDLDVFGVRHEQRPAEDCPSIAESGQVRPTRAEVGRSPAVIANIVRDQAVPGTIGAARSLPDDWFGTGAEVANEALLLCEYLLTTDPPNGAMCAYAGVDLDLVAGRYRFVVLRSGSPGTVRAVFELRGEPGPTEACPATIDAAQRHAPVVYPPRTGELMAELQPLIEGSG